MVTNGKQGHGSVDVLTMPGRARDIREMLKPLHCPSCGAELAPRSGPVVSSSDFVSCLRRCDKAGCRVGFSNARTRPTTIWADPLRNVPAEVRAGAKHAVLSALNERNRTSKWTRFGFSTSEDAVTWTFFSWLTSITANAQISIYNSLLGVRADAAPRMLLWGTEITASGCHNIRTALIGAADQLGEAPHSRSEPDVVLDFGPAGIVFIEVKFRSGNDKLRSDSPKWHRYLHTSDAFADTDAVKASGLYELARNWRFAWDLRAGRPMALVNLGRSDLFGEESTHRLDTLEAGLSLSDDARLLRLEWRTVLDQCASIAPFPAWMSDYLHRRELLP
jgi:hypothetical protein